MLWDFSSSFSIYAVSRIVGGLSEGNVQLSVAIISDVTSPSQRAKSLALVGAAFSLAFTVSTSSQDY
jgi:predicted MFS family arabinose efflux permease